MKYFSTLISYISDCNASTFKELAKLPIDSSLKTRENKPMTKTETYMAWLTEQGYRPELDNDQDISFKHERINFVLFANEKDETFFRLLVPYFWELETDEETQKATSVIMKLNTDYKSAKFYSMQNDVCVAIEAFYGSPEDVFPVLGRLIDLLASAMREFKQLMREEAVPKPPMAQA